MHSLCWVVNEKGHTKDYDEYWIKAYDPNDQTKAEAFKIMIKEEMVWELIEEKKKYFSSYQKKGLTVDFRINRESGFGRDGKMKSRICL